MQHINSVYKQSSVILVVQWQRMTFIHSVSVQFVKNRFLSPKTSYQSNSGRRMGKETDTSMQVDGF